MFPNNYKFSDFTLDTKNETLCRGDDLLKLNLRTFQVLKLLVENAGNVVTKDDFFEKVWTGAFVEDNNLTVAVAQIRKALGETKDNKFIKTLPKKGYCFVAEVETVFDKSDVECSEDSAIANESKIEKPIETKKGFFAVAASRKYLSVILSVVVLFAVGWFWRQNSFSNQRSSEPFRSIAVLPFSPNQNTPNNQIFTEKLTQELIYNLGRITDTRVSSYESIAVYNLPEVNTDKAGNDLQVDGMVTGKISENELVINFNDLRTGATIFTKNYSLKPQDFADTQYRIAGDIANQLGVEKQSPNQKATENLEAYQAYLQGRYFLTKDSSADYEKAIENFTLATVKDANFADAHSGLATAHIRHGLTVYAARGLSASRRSFPSAKESALASLALKPDSDEALAALAFVNFNHEYDWKNAEANFRKAIEINPNNLRAHRWFGNFLHCLGRFDEGFVSQQKALEIEPNSARILSEIAWGNYLARRFDEAAVYSQKALYIDKTNAATLYNLSEIYEHKGNIKEAVGLWKEAMMIEAAARRFIADIEKFYQKDGHQGFARAKTVWLENLIEKDYVYPTDLAKGYAVLGENEKAVNWLEKGIEARVPDILSIKYAPTFDNLKEDARYQTILTKMNFPQ